MRDIAFIFFLAAVLSVIGGMGLGIWMGIAHDFTLAPAHAHLNLVGWVTLALFGVYYRVTPQAAESPLAGIHAALAIGGAAVMVLGLVMALLGGATLVAILGSLTTAASMLLFLVVVVRHGFGARPTAKGADRELWLGATS